MERLRSGGLGGEAGRLEAGVKQGIEGLLGGLGAVGGRDLTAALRTLTPAAAQLGSVFDEVGVRVEGLGQQRPTQPHSSFLPRGHSNAYPS